MEVLRGVGRLDTERAAAIGGSEDRSVITHHPRDPGLGRETYGVEIARRAGRQALPLAIVDEAQARAVVANSEHERRAVCAVDAGTRDAEQVLAGSRVLAAAAPAHDYPSSPTAM